MAHLQQLQVGYNQLHDRLVLTLFTNDWSEYRFWITRHAVQALWKILQQLLEAGKQNESQLEKEKSEVKKKIQDEKSQRKAEAEKYASRLTRRPMGDEPLLIAKMMAKPGPQGQFILHLEDNQNHMIEFAGDIKILTALSHLILNAVKQADWALNLEF